MIKKMLMQKKCWQKEHPQWQTSCFIKGAGGKPCSHTTCAIEDALPDHPVYKMFVDQLAKESAVRCWLFHYVCRMSNSSPNNQEYLARLNRKKNG